MKRLLKRLTVLSMVMAMAMSLGVMPSSAASKVPKIEEIKYCGKGIVEVEFIGNVKYSKSKVTVKDNKGKKYTARVVKRDSDDIKFRINKYKAGRIYTFKISRVRNWRGGKYRTVVGKVRIKSASGFIGVAKAKMIALNNAKLKANQVRFKKAKIDYDDGRYIYEIEFQRGYIEYEYEIHAKTGQILSRDIERD